MQGLGGKIKYHNIFDHLPQYRCCDNTGLEDSFYFHKILTQSEITK